MSLTTLTLRQYRFILVVAASLLAIGLLGYVEMPRQEDPSMPAFEGVATILYPGASVDEVEDRVIEPLEEILNEMEEVEEITSTTVTGAAVVRADFREDVDTEEAYDLFAQRVSEARRVLPEGVTDVRLVAAKPSNVAVFQIAIHGIDADPTRLREWAEELESRLRVLPDAKAVTVEATRDREAHVTIDADRLAAAGLTIGEIVDAIGAANRSVPGTGLRTRDEQLTVRAYDRYQDLEDVSGTVIRAIEGRPLLVEHVADVSWGLADARHLASFDGEPAALVTVTLKEGRTVMALARGVHRTLERFRSDLPQDLTASIVVDQSESVRRSLATFSTSLLQGGLIIVVLVSIVIGWRPALAVVTALVASVGISFGFMNGFGVALQQISIVGLVIVLGLLVDNAIVVVEGILEARHAGEDAARAAITGTDRVASAVAASTATTIAAFVPMMRTEGSVGAFTRDIPIVVTLVLVVSLAVALFITPLVAMRLLRSPGSARLSGLSPLVDRHVAGRLYPRLLDAVLARPLRTIAVTAVVVAIIVSMSGLVGMNFFPAAEKNLFLAQVECPTGTDLDVTDARAAVVDRWLRDQPEVLAVTRNSGRGNPQVYYNQERAAEDASVAELLVTVTDEHVSDVPDLARRLRERFADTPEFVVNAKPFVQGPPIGQPVSIELTGPDLERAQRPRRGPRGRALQRARCDQRQQRSPSRRAASGSRDRWRSSRQARPLARNGRARGACRARGARSPPCFVSTTRTSTSWSGSLRATPPRRIIWSACVSPSVTAGRYRSVSSRVPA